MLPINSLSGVLSASLFLAGASAQESSRETQEEFGPGHRYGLLQAPSAAEGSIRIGSYNVLNYFDDVDDPALSGEWDDAELASRPGQLVALAAAIRELDADVLALQEVESLDALLRFRDRHLADMGYVHVASLDAGYYRGVEQSVLSRIPITRTLNWPGLSTADVTRSGADFQPLPDRPLLSFQRSPLMVELRSDEGYEFTLIVVHLKSGGLAHAYRREAEGLLPGQAPPQGRAQGVAVAAQRLAQERGRARRMRDGRPHHLLLGRGVLLPDLGGVAQLLAGQCCGEAHPFCSCSEALALCCSVLAGACLVFCERLSELRGRRRARRGTGGCPAVSAEAGI